MYKFKKGFNGSLAKRAAVALASVGAVAVSSAAHAVVDITADATAAKADVATVGGIIVGVMVAIAVIAWIRKVVH
jgi:Inovirus Coat protein B